MSQQGSSLTRRTALPAAAGQQGLGAGPTQCFTSQRTVAGTHLPRLRTAPLPWSPSCSSLPCLWARSPALAPPEVCLQRPQRARLLLPAVQGHGGCLWARPPVFTPLDSACSVLSAPACCCLLCRIMVAAGCPVDRPGTRVVAGYGREPLSTAHWWLLLLAGAREEDESEWEEVQSEGSGGKEEEGGQGEGQAEGEEPLQGVVPWLAPPSGVALAASRELLAAAAAQRPKGRPEFLAHAVAAGSPELVRMVLELFPSMAAHSRRQRRAGASTLQAALAALAGALCRLTPPAQVRCRIVGGAGARCMPAWFCCLLFWPVRTCLAWRNVACQAARPLPGTPPAFDVGIEQTQSSSPRLSSPPAG